jgi:hypothetical protein
LGTSEGKAPQPYLELFDREFNPFHISLLSSRDYVFPSLQSLGQVVATVESASSLRDTYNIRDNNVKVVDSNSNGNFTAVYYFQTCLVSEDILDGQTCIKLNWVFNIDATIEHPEEKTVQNFPVINSMTCWVDPQKDYIIRQSERAIRQHSNVFIAKIKNKVSLDKKSGIWFPSRWVYENKRNDEELEQENCTLEVLSVNQPFESKFFR